MSARNPNFAPRQIKTGISCSKALGQGESKNVVALLGAKLTVAAGGDDQILLAFKAECHRCGLAAGRELEFPELFAGFGVKGAQVIVHCGGGENEAACGDDGAAESDRPRIHARKQTA